MILSDHTIKIALKSGELRIEPTPQDRAIQPASVDLNLGPQFWSPYEDEPRTFDKFLYLKPGECMLGETAEHITVPDWLMARVEGKSSWGRRFLSVHVTAGFIDPGFAGKVTLELVNLSRISQLVPVGQPICQLSFEQLTTSADRPYGHPELGNHYQNQHGVTPSALGWT